MNKFKGSNVLITGGAGFLGRHLTEELLRRQVRKVVIYSRDEHKHEVSKDYFEDDIGRLRFITSDVLDTDYLRYAIGDIDFVIHAAALKIIPTGQYNPLKFTDVNLLGWRSMLRAVLDSGKRIKVLGISSDKAVEAINTYGKAKALGEDLFIHGNVYSPYYKFACVRFGNVIGSTSSLLAGKKLPGLTHIDMTRFFLTVKDAVDLTLYALEEMYGGEIFVPKCRACRIHDVMRMLTGKTKFNILGTRPGEKIHEVLINEYEMQRTIEQDGYYVVLPEEFAHTGHRYHCPEYVEPFEYSSKNEDLRMTEEEMRGIFNVKREGDQGVG